MKAWPKSVFPLPTPDYGDYAEVDLQLRRRNKPISIRAGQNDWEVSGSTDLTPTQARQLAALLVEAADEAQRPERKKGRS
jgi:hypothetical protein